MRFGGMRLHKPTKVSLAFRHAPSGAHVAKVKDVMKLFFQGGRLLEQGQRARDDTLRGQGNEEWESSRFNANDFAG